MLRFSQRRSETDGGEDHPDPPSKNPLPALARAGRASVAWIRLAAGDNRALADRATVLRQASDDDTRYIAHLLRAAAVAGGPGPVRAMGLGQSPGGRAFCSSHVRVGLFIPG
jgi:hypothetical protein